MPFELAALSDLEHLPFDEIIDVRAPSEFAEDRVPAAHNLPVLSDAERARVGTIYVQQDRFLARKTGAALVARNAAAHLEGALADRPGGWRPLVYCWRGGQRSGAFASILAQIGWRVETLAGGYRSYRRLVVQMLYERALPAQVVVIDGGTGTAKTRLLGHLAAQGAQVLDLEEMAAHRGSVFGPTGRAQPSQKRFESRIAMALAGMDLSRRIFVEAESNKIGQLLVPPSLWQAMIAAHSVRIDAPLGARVAHLVADYADLIAAPERLAAILGKLVRYHGRARVAAWQALAREGAYDALVRDLIVTHYDPRYARIARRGLRPEPLSLPDLSDATLALAARRLCETRDQPAM